MSYDNETKNIMFYCMVVFTRNITISNNVMLTLHFWSVNADQIGIDA